MADEIIGINSAEPLCTKKATLEQAQQNMPESEVTGNRSIFDTETGIPKTRIEVAQKPIKTSEIKKAEAINEELYDGKPHYFNYFMMGFLGQTLKLMNNIINHPVKMGLTILGTAAALLSLPLIGIPSTVGAATLAVIYGTTSLIKTGINLAKFIKHKSENNIEATQKDMEHLGENSLDLALSLPFLPKGIKEVSRFAKYGKIGVNYGLIKNISNAEGSYAKFRAFFSGTKQLDADIKTIEIMKQNLTPEQVKEIMPLLKLDNRTFAQKIHEIMNKEALPHNSYGDKTKFFIAKGKSENGYYSHFDKAIVLNSKYIDFRSKADIVSSLVHEFQHYKQHILIDRAELYDRGLKAFSSIPSNAGLSRKALIKKFDKICKEVFCGIEYFSPIKPTKHIRNLINADKNYVDADVNYQAYWHNFLEVDARTAQIPTLPVSTAKDAFLQAKQLERDYMDEILSVSSAFRDIFLANFFIGNEKSIAATQKAEPQ